MKQAETLEQKRDRILRELAEEGERVLTQDNRITAHPVFCVQQERRVYQGPYKDRSDGYELLDEDYNFVSDHPEDIFYGPSPGEEDEKVLEDEDGCRGRRLIVCYYQKVWEDVSVFFTEAGADFYIHQNRHNLNNPRVYVKSAYRNSEWIKIRELLATLGEIQRFQKACGAEEDHGDPPPLHAVGDG